MASRPTFTTLVQLAAPESSESRQIFASTPLTVRYMVERVIEKRNENKEDIETAGQNEVPLWQTFMAGSQLDDDELMQQIHEGRFQERATQNFGSSRKDVQMYQCLAFHAILAILVWNDKDFGDLVLSAVTDVFRIFIRAQDVLVHGYETETIRDVYRTTLPGALDSYRTNYSSKLSIYLSSEEWANLLRHNGMPQSELKHILPAPDDNTQTGNPSVWGYLRSSFFWSNVFLRGESNSRTIWNNEFAWESHRWFPSISIPKKWEKINDLSRQYTLWMPVFLAPNLLCSLVTACATISSRKTSNQDILFHDRLRLVESILQNAQAGPRELIVGFPIQYGLDEAISVERMWVSIGMSNSNGSNPHTNPYIPAIAWNRFTNAQVLFVRKHPDARGNAIQEWVNLWVQEKRTQVPETDMESLFQVTDPWYDVYDLDNPESNEQVAGFGVYHLENFLFPRQRAARFVEGVDSMTTVARLVLESKAADNTTSIFEQLRGKPKQEWVAIVHQMLGMTDLFGGIVQQAIDQDSTKQEFDGIKFPNQRLVWYYRQLEQQDRLARQNQVVHIVMFETTFDIPENTCRLVDVRFPKIELLLSTYSKDQTTNWWLHKLVDELYILIRNGFQPGQNVSIASQSTVVVPLLGNTLEYLEDADGDIRMGIVDESDQPLHDVVYTTGGFRMEIFALRPTSTVAIQASQIQIMYVLGTSIHVEKNWKTFNIGDVVFHVTSKYTRPLNVVEGKVVVRTHCDGVIPYVAILPYGGVKNPFSPFHLFHVPTMLVAKNQSDLKMPINESRFVYNWDGRIRDATGEYALTSTHPADRGLVYSRLDVERPVLHSKIKILNDRMSKKIDDEKQWDKMLGKWYPWVMEELQLAGSTPVEPNTSQFRAMIRDGVSWDLDIQHCSWVILLNQKLRAGVVNTQEMRNPQTGRLDIHRVGNVLGLTKLIDKFTRDSERKPILGIVLGKVQDALRHPSSYQVAMLYAALANIKETPCADIPILAGILHALHELWVFTQLVDPSRKVRSEPIDEPDVPSVDIHVNLDLFATLVFPDTYAPEHFDRLTLPGGPMERLADVDGNELWREKDTYWVFKKAVRRVQDLGRRVPYLTYYGIWCPFLKAIVRPTLLEVLRIVMFEFTGRSYNNANVATTFPNEDGVMMPESFPMFNISNQDSEAFREQIAKTFRSRGYMNWQVFSFEFWILMCYGRRHFPRLYWLSEAMRFNRMNHAGNAYNSRNVEITLDGFGLVLIGPLQSMCFQNMYASIMGAPSLYAGWTRQWQTQSSYVSYE